MSQIDRRMRAVTATVGRIFKGAPVLWDGAMGTMLYARGVFINRSYDELNLSQPELVRVRSIQNIRRQG